MASGRASCGLPTASRRRFLRVESEPYPQESWDNWNQLDWHGTERQQRSTDYQAYAVLDELGLPKKSVMVYLSDHGARPGEQGHESVATQARRAYRESGWRAFAPSPPTVLAQRNPRLGLRSAERAKLRCAHVRNFGTSAQDPPRSTL